MTTTQRLAIALATILDRLPTPRLRRRKPTPNPIITGSVFIHHTGIDTPDIIARKINEDLLRGGSISAGRLAIGHITTDQLHPIVRNSIVAGRIGDKPQGIA